MQISAAFDGTVEWFLQFRIQTSLDIKLTRAFRTGCLFLKDHKQLSFHIIITLPLGNVSLNRKRDRSAEIFSYFTQHATALCAICATGPGDPT